MTSRVSAEVAVDWCAVCGTRHSRVRCLGEVLAIQPERHGWRGTFMTPRGKKEAIGVLIAQSDRGWRARVLTYPRRLWTVPGTTCTIKFVSETPEDAERQARQFIEEHCSQRGYRPVEQGVPGASVDCFPPEQTRNAAEADATRRRVCELPVRFAMDGGPVLDADVVLMSERGLFLATDVSASIGDEVRIQAELAGISVLMTGVIRSIRGHATPGRPQGLGIRLSDPPARYVSYVRRLS